MKNEKIWFRVFGKLSRMGLLKWVGILFRI